jgi:hypothetical protein
MTESFKAPIKDNVTREAIWLSAVKFNEKFSENRVFVGEFEAKNENT